MRSERALETLYLALALAILTIIIGVFVFSQLALYREETPNATRPTTLLYTLAEHAKACALNASISGSECSFTILLASKHQLECSGTNLCIGGTCVDLAKALGVENERLSLQCVEGRYSRVRVTVLYDKTSDRLVLTIS